MVCDRHACSSFSRMARRQEAGVYCACHTKRQPRARRRPRAPQLLHRRLCVLHLPHEKQPQASGGHTRRSSSRRMHATQLLQEALCIASATRKAARKLCVLRLPHESQPRARRPRAAAPRLCVMRLPHESQPRARRRPRAQQQALCTPPAT